MWSPATEPGETFIPCLKTCWIELKCTSLWHGIHFSLDFLYGHAPGHLCLSERAVYPLFKEIPVSHFERSQPNESNLKGEIRRSREKNLDIELCARLLIQELRRRIGRGGIAQSVRVLVCHARSRGFDPRFPRARRKKIANIRRVSNPNLFFYGARKAGG